jgi:hypothetical protein
VQADPVDRPLETERPAGQADRGNLPAWWSRKSSMATRPENPI